MYEPLGSLSGHMFSGGNEQTVTSGESTAVDGTHYLQCQTDDRCVCVCVWARFYVTETTSSGCGNM